MKRSRLKNIINKSKSVSNKQEVKNPFDEFKKSLPIEIDDNYRLEAAWKAYGSPKDYKSALWEGMIQPIDENTYKLPSIGYNEETDEYEYLNKGKDNETVAKDIRVWDNDVIPLVQELKLGGYVRTFNEEKDCWTYTKNSQKREQSIEDKGEQVIDSFQKGGKPRLNSKETGEDPIGYLNDGTHLYKKGDGTIGPLTKENIGKDNLFDLIKNSNANFAKRLQDPNRKYITYPDGSIGNFKLAWSEDETGTIVYPEIQEIDGQLIDLSGDREKAWESAIEHKDYIYFPSNDAADWFTKNYKNYYKGFDRTPQTFKQGGKTLKEKLEEDGEWIDIVNSGRMKLDKSKLDQDQLSGKKPIGELNREKLYLIGDKIYFESDIPKQELEKFKQGGQMNVIPEGALHARKNNMEGAGKDFTHKGIPVIDDDGKQQAEIEREEVIFNKEVTEKLENYYKQYNDDSKSQSEKDEIAIKAGKLLAKQLMENTEDRTGLIEKVEAKS